MLRNWTGWDNTKKPFDRDRPFHRINSSVFKQEEVLREGESEESRRERADKLRANGRGYDRGCRLPTDIPPISLGEVIVLLFGTDARKVMRVIPSWVKVEDADEIKEIEGVLLRKLPDVD
ncbi:MAG: hypothetical protein WKF84_30845 [Pyrinomonadaceae bacterium]